MGAFLQLTDIHRAYPAARKRGASHNVLTGAVLDAAFDVVLHELARHDLYTACDLVFKGGTALRKFDIGHKGRLSFDLDFNTSEPVDTVAGIVDEALRAMPDCGFRMHLRERRGHYLLVVQSDLLPGAEYEAKIDFSQRGACLQPRIISPREHPLSASYPFDMDFKVPVIDLDENIAEKLTRWGVKPIVRDLYDVSELAGRVSDPAQVAAMYVLKAYRAWSTTPSNRRIAPPAVPLMDTMERTTEESFDLSELTMPSAPSDAEKKRIIKQRLQRLAGLFDQLDIYVRSEGLQRFASNTDGSLMHEAEDALARMDTIGYLSGPPGHGLGLIRTDTLGFTAEVTPDALLRSSSTKRDICGATTKSGGKCGQAAPAIGKKCAAGHRRRR